LFIAGRNPLTFFYHFHFIKRSLRASLDVRSTCTRWWLASQFHNDSTSQNLNKNPKSTCFWMKYSHRRNVNGMHDDAEPFGNTSTWAMPTPNRVDCISMVNRWEG
jgi:hypothetical protein